jgi:hypothetical protein
MNEAKKVKTPIEGTADEEDNTKENNTFPYREAAGSLLYLSNKTRPDMTYAISYNSRFVENPNATNIVNIKRALRYLVGTMKDGIKFKAN